MSGRSRLLSHIGTPLPTSRFPFWDTVHSPKLAVVPFLDLLGRRGAKPDDECELPLRLPTAGQVMSRLTLSSNDLLEMPQHDLQSYIRNVANDSGIQTPQYDNLPGVALFNVMGTIRRTALGSPPASLSRNEIIRALANRTRPIADLPTHPTATVGLCIPFVTGLGIASIMWNGKYGVPSLVVPSAIRGGAQVGQFVHPVDPAFTFAPRIQPTAGMAAPRILAYRSDDLCTSEAMEPVDPGAFDMGVWDGRAFEPSTSNDHAVVSPISRAIGDVIGVSLRNARLFGAHNVPPAVYGAYVSGTRLSFFRLALDCEAADDDAWTEGAGEDDSLALEAGASVPLADRRAWSPLLRRLGGAADAYSAQHNQAALPDLLTALNARTQQPAAALGGRLLIECDFGPAVAGDTSDSATPGPGADARGAGYGPRRAPALGTMGYDLTDPQERCTALHILAALRQAVATKGARAVLPHITPEGVDDVGLDSGKRDAETSDPTAALLKSAPKMSWVS